MKLSKLAVLIIFAVLTAAVFCSPVIASTTITVGSADNAELNQKVTIPVTITTDATIGLFSFVVDNHTSNANIILNETYMPQSQHVTYNFGVDTATSSLKVGGTARGTTFTGENQALFSIDVTPTSESVIPINITEVKLGYGTTKITDFTVVNGTVSTVSAPPSVKHSITNNFNHTSSSNLAASINSGSSYSATITADTGYTLDYVNVSMGGADITASAVNAGIIYVASVTGDLVINSSANPETSAEVIYDGTVNLVNGTTSIQYTDGTCWTGRSATALGAIDKAAFTVSYDSDWNPVYPFTYNLTNNSWGPYVSKINNYEATSSAPYVYWAFYLNGVSSTTGVAETPVKAGDVLTFAYGDGSSISGSQYIVNITVSDIKEQQIIYDDSVSLVNGTTRIKCGDGTYFTGSSATALGALDKAAFTGSYDFNWNLVYPFNYTISSGQYGAYLEDINGISGNGKYWFVFVNGAPSPVGISLANVDDSDVVTYVFGDGREIGTSEYIVNITVSYVAEQQIIHDGSVSVINDTVKIAYTDGTLWTGSGATALGAIDVAHANNFTYNLSKMGEYPYIESVNNINAQGNDYWAFFVNGVSSNTGVADTSISAGDILTLAYGDGREIGTSEYIVNVTVGNLIEPNYIYKGDVTVVNNTLWLAGAMDWDSYYYYPYLTDAGALAAGAAAGHYTYDWTPESFGSDTPYLWMINDINGMVSGEKIWYSFINGEYVSDQNITSVDDGDVVSFLYVEDPTAGYNAALAAAGNNAVILKVNVEEGPIEIANVEVTVNGDETVEVSNGNAPWSASQTLGAGVLAVASEMCNFTYNCSNEGWLGDINGIAPDFSSTGYGWSYTLNGNSTSVLTNFTVSDGDVLIFANMPSTYGGMPVFDDIDTDSMDTILGYDWHKLTIHIKDVTPIHIITTLPEKVTAGTPAVFTANITTNRSGIVNSETTYTWKFGDSTSAVGSVAEKTYTTAGTYEVSVTAANNGVTNTTKYSVTVDAAPKAITEPVTSNVTGTVIDNLDEEKKPVIIFDNSTLSGSENLNVTIDKYETVPATVETEINSSGKTLPPNSAAVLLYMNVSTVEGVGDAHNLGAYAELKLNITLNSYTAENISFFRYAEGATVGEKLKSAILNKSAAGIWAEYSVMVPGFSAIVASVNQETPAAAVADPVTPVYDGGSDDDYSYTPSSGSTATPTKTPTAKVTATPVKTSEPVETSVPSETKAPSTPATAAPSAQPTSTPAPFIGLIAALGAAAVLLRRK